MPRSIRDAALANSRALPNGAATVSSTGIDLGHTTRGEFLVGHDLLITAPAVGVGVFADGGTIKYSIETDHDPAFGSPLSLYPDVLTQTAAGGAGAAAATKRVALPSNVERYVRLKAVKSNAGDASGLTAKLELLF